MRHAIVAFGIVALLATTAGAAEYTVTTVADTVDAAPADGVCSTPSGCSLRAAIQTANASAGLDTILVPAGTYTLTRAGTGEDAAATGDLDVVDDVQIYGVDEDLTVVDGGGLDRVFELFADTLMTDLTIRGGQLSADNGAGLRVQNPHRLTIRHARVTDNDCASGHPSLDNGGGIQVVGDGELVAEHVEIDANVAQRSAGISIGYASIVTLDEVWIHDNEAAVQAGGLSAGGTTTIRRSAITGNHAGNNSFAMVLSVDAQVLVQNSTISGNGPLAASSFGTIGSYGGSTLALENATIAANQGNRTLDGEATVTLRNTIVSNPDASVECEAGITVVSAGYNLDSDGSCAGTGTGDQPSSDPLLLALGAYGGDTPAQLPTDASPVIDAGNPGDCTAIGGTPLALDQRGATRTFDGDGDGILRCDIGAVEVPEPVAALAGSAALGALAALAGLRRRGRQRERRTRTRSG